MPELRAPALPGELAPTRPAPNPLQRLTVRRPTPPSAVARMRRTDPPAATATPVVANGTTLPPESQEPVHHAQRRALEAKDTALDELRQQLQRAQLELELERTRARSTSSAPPKGWSDPKMVKAVWVLLGALGTLATPLGIWLTAKATALESAQQRQDRTTQEATATASSAKAESSTTDKRIDELQQQLSAERAYNREVLRRLGVQVPKRPGDPDPPELKTETPLRKPGAITPAPVLVVTTPPP